MKVYLKYTMTVLVQEDNNTWKEENKEPPTPEEMVTQLKDYIQDDPGFFLDLIGSPRVTSPVTKIEIVTKEEYDAQNRTPEV